jgi:geranylgeranylglycerol-phosphate geranylgeranyltransferase
MKFTVKQSYDKVEYLPVKIRGVADLLRPFTIGVAFLSGIFIAIGVLKYYNLPLHFYWKEAIYAGSVFAFVTGASNALNQYTDLAEDKVSKSYRPIPQGIVTPHEAHTIAYLLYFAGLVRAFILSPSFGIFVTIIALITIFYSLEPVRLKKRFMINNYSLAVARGYLPVIALWSVWGDLSNSLPHYFGIALVLYLIGATTTKDFHDIRGDSEQGIKTLPTTIGHGPTVATIGFFFILSYLWFYGIGMWEYVTLSPLSVAVMITLNKTSELHEYTRAWMISYINLMLFYFYWAILL